MQDKPRIKTTTTLLSLPPELHLLIGTYLRFPDIVYFRITCAYLYALLPPLTHSQLLLAETTDYALSRDIYACRYCLRLRPASRFADRMRRRRRGRYGRDADKRFCVECGLRPRAGTDEEARYGPGAQVRIDGVLYVICITCRTFGLGYGGGIECQGCGLDRERVRRRKLLLNGESTDQG
ncbi:hypothetical protein CDV55_104793 [Aspergillus turcosus]|uniref:F-box domain-containing protein n=1 Tax=Aspergillus turcosus TaxID=1245748 RepID=A0A229X508_9EURO|nr:hypothetical protein CDV55_104793 [Aspergillus turcosus]RLL95281.1 hypothetical protein CFD26_105115 [Aspergillus turcosus]